jgi:ABC-2 type transport system ATP-binding protein
MTGADALCDRLAIIDHGRLIALDTPEHLKKALGRDIVTLRTTPAVADPQTIFSDLGVQDVVRTGADQLRLEVRDAETVAGELVTRVTAGHQLESIHIARPTLDDVFLHHTGRALRE